MPCHPETAPPDEVARVNLLMCAGCGEFTTARVGPDGPRPLRDACSHCGGRTFKNPETDQVVSLGQ